MGDNFNHQRIQLYGSAINKHKISYTHIMLSWLSDIVDQQVRFLEAKGAWITVPLFGVTSYILAWFADIRIIENGFDLFKNITLSLIGIAMGVMGVINTYIGMKNRIKKYKQENNPHHKKDKQNIA